VSRSVNQKVPVRHSVKFTYAWTLFCFVVKCIILLFLGILTIGIQNSYILQLQAQYDHIYLLRLVVLKRPGFQSQKYGMPKVTWIKNIVRSTVSVRSRFARSAVRARAASAIKYFFKHMSCRTECLLKQWIFIEQWIWSPIQMTVTFTNNKATRADMNEPSKQRTYWRYHCSVTYVENLSYLLSGELNMTWELFIYCYVTNVISFIVSFIVT